MARDRFDDPADDDFDDRPRRRDDESDRDDGSDDRPRRGPVASRTKTGIPGVLLILCGVVAGLFGLYNVYAAVTDPDQVVTQYEAQIKEIEATQPAGPERDKQVEFMRTVQRNARLDSPPIVALIAVWVAVAGLMLLGGYSLYSRGSYGLALAGSIVALIPCTNNLICLAMPVGLYAVIVLLMSDVKAAFRANRGREPLDGEA